MEVLPFKFNEYTEYVRFAAEARNALAGANQVGGKEIDLFVAFVLAWGRFGTISTPEAKRWILGQGFSDTGFSRYRKTLCKKGWIKKEVSGLAGTEYRVGTVYKIPDVFLPMARRQEISAIIEYSGLDS